jgi:hypothetical protein
MGLKAQKTLPVALRLSHDKILSAHNHQTGVEYVPYHRGSVSSSRIRCRIFSARLVPLGLAKSAGRAAEGFGGRSCYRKFHRNFHQRSGGHLSGRSLRSGGPRSRLSGRVPDVQELDVRLQSDHGLVRTLCQPDDRCHQRDRDIRRPGWPRGKGARHGSFPAHLNEAGWLSLLDAGRLTRNTCMLGARAVLNCFESGLGRSSDGPSDYRSCNDAKPHVSLVACQLTAMQGFG